MRRLLCFLLPWLAACASIKVDHMVPEKTSYGAHHPATVAVDTGGGTPGVVWYSGTLKPEDLSAAIQKSIEEGRLFRQVLATDAADYVLSVMLVYAGSHPGFTMTGWVEINWSLAKRGGAEVWSAKLKTNAKATVGDAFSGAARQYLAIERAAKINIEQALDQIGALKLSGR